MKTEAIDSRRCSRNDGNPCCNSQNVVEKTLALSSIEALGVIEPGQAAAIRATQPAVVEQHRRRHQGAGKAAASGLIHARDPWTKGAIKVNE